MGAVPTCLIAFLLLSSATCSSKTCYRPGGQNRDGPYSTPANSTYQPCNPTDGTVSMCCAVWDTCMPNGLCWNDAYHIWWRESCTDPDFTDPNCVKLFLNYTEDVVVSNCTDGSWCLGRNNTGCCARHTGVFLVANNDTLPAESLYNSSATTTTTTTPSLVSPSTSTVTVSKSDASHSLSTGARAGIGVGISAIVLLVLSLIYFFIRHSRRKRSIELPSDLDKRKEPSAELAGETPSLGPASPIEKDGSRLRTNVPVEME